MNTKTVSCGCMCELPSISTLQIDNNSHRKSRIAKIEKTPPEVHNSTTFFVNSIYLSEYVKNNPYLRNKYMNPRLINQL